MSARPGLAELLDEIHAHAARQEHEDRLGRGRGDLGELRRIVELVERDIDFVEHLALEVALEPGERVFARLVVRRHDERLLDPLVLRIFAQHLVVLVVLVRGDEEVRVASLPAKFEVPAFGEIRIAPPSVTGFIIAIRMFEKIGPTTKSTLSRSTKALALPTATSGFSSSSCTMQLDLASAELAAERLERQLEAVALLHAERGGRARQRGQDADLELVLRGGLRGRQGQVPQRASVSSSRPPESLLRPLAEYGPAARRVQWSGSADILSFKYLPCEAPFCGHIGARVGTPAAVYAVIKLTAVGGASRVFCGCRS